MTKILSQSGISLADVYDVEGSIAGVEQLLSEDVTLSHEMGSTLFSERLSGSIRRAQAVNIIQSATYDVTLVNFPTGVWRVLGITVLANIIGRVDRCQVSLRDPLSEREIPLFIWDSANNVETLIRIQDNGAAVGAQLALIGGQVQTPNLGIGTSQPQRVGQEIVLRGNTLAFGAGAVTLTVLVYIAFSQTTAVSSRGLPVPGW